LSARAKFLFDVDFSGDTVRGRTISLAAHEEALAKAYRDGVAAGEARMSADAASRASVAFERIADGLDELRRGFAAIEGRLEAEAVEVAVAVAKKLAAELIAREPVAEIAALVRDCFTHVLAAPHVMVRVSDTLLDQARAQLEEIARMRGFDGRLVILGEPTMAAGDCRIEWADGGIVRERAATEAAIAEAVDRYTGVCRAASA